MFTKFLDYSIVQWDSFQNILTIADKSLDLTITSPPYNIGKSYEKKVNLDAYLAPYKEFASILYNKTSETWHICWQVWNYVNDGQVIPLDIVFYDIFKQAWFTLRNRIIRHFEHGLHAKKRFSWRYETILWFSKTDNYIFNLDDVRVPQKYPWKKHFKWNKKWEYSWNPLWKNPSDFRTVTQNDWSNEIRDIPNVKSNHPEKTSHPCQFPIELVQRCILALTNPWDMVFDPFLWAWSTILASLMLERKSLWFELDNAYIEETERRIKSYIDGDLRFRPIDKKIFQPTWKEKASLIPSQWNTPLFANNILLWK